MIASLVWRTVTSYDGPKYQVKGTVLSSALYGPNSRFLIEEVRALTVEREQKAVYRVRDAHGVTDAEVREGKPSPIVFRADLPTDCVEWCDAQLKE